MSLPTTPNEGVAPSPTTICVFCGSSPGLSPAYMEAARSLAHAFHKNNVRLVYGGGTVGLMGEIASTLTSLSGPNAVHGIIPKALIKYEQSGRPAGGETPASPVTIEATTATATSETTTTASETTISTTSAEATTTTATTTAPPKPERQGSALQVPSQQRFGQTTVVSSMHERKQLMTQMVLDGGPGSGFIALPGGYGTLEELAEVTTWNQLGIHKAGIVLYDVEGYWGSLVKWIDQSTAAGFISEKNRDIIRCAEDAEGCLRELREYSPSSARFDLDWSESKVSK